MGAARDPPMNNQLQPTGRRGRSTDHSIGSAWSSTHAILLIAAAGLLGTSLFLEGILRSRLADDVHGHEHIPLVVHGSAVFSVLLSLWPIVQKALVAFRLRNPDWRLVIVAGIVALLAMSYTMAGSVAAFLFSLAMLLWRSRRPVPTERRPFP